MFKKLLCNERGDVIVTDPAPEPTPAPVATPEPATAPAPADEPPADPAPAEPATPEVGLKAALKAEREKRQKLAEELAYLKGKVDAVAPTPTPAPAAPAAPQAPVRPVRPQAAQFEVWSEFEAAEARYEEDLEKYHEEHTKFVVAQTIEVKANQVRQQEAQQKAVQTFKERLNKAAETDPELLDIVANYHLPNSPHHVPINDAMVDVITESEVGPELIRALANDKKLAANIAGMSPLAAARELGKIEAKLTAPVAPPPRVSQAPEPVTTITPTGVVKEFDPETAPMEEYYKVRMAQRQRR